MSVMKNFVNFNIFTRIAMLVVLCLVAVGVSTYLNIADVGSTRMALRQEQLVSITDAAYNLKKQQIGVSIIEHFEKSIMLQVLDGLWREHLAAVD